MSVVNTLEGRHRERKRKAEMEIVINRIVPFLRSGRNIRILEFGSGDGYQIPYLRRLGNVIASDISQNEAIVKNYPDARFTVCDIRRTSFASKSFDLVFANHVLEHIENITGAFDELKRIGTQNCIYAFTVPTSVWLLLSLPAQFYNGMRKLLKKIFKVDIIKRDGVRDARIKGWRRFLPRGHGWRDNFFDCLKSFRMKNWQNLFCENGFKIKDIEPLLLYAPSEFPIIPTTRFLVSNGICSSAIFILNKYSEK